MNGPIHNGEYGGGEGWLGEYVREFEHDPEFIAEGLAIEVTEQAARIMRETGLSRAQLAKLMHVSRAYVTRLFSAPPNMTLLSIAQLGSALGAVPAIAFNSVRTAEMSQCSATGTTAASIVATVAPAPIAMKDWLAGFVPSEPILEPVFQTRAKLADAHLSNSSLGVRSLVA